MHIYLILIKSCTETFIYQEIRYSFDSYSIVSIEGF